MNKFTKVWFDEALGDFHRQEIPYDSIFEKVDAERGTLETTMRLTLEELMARFCVDIKAHAPATPEIWYAMDFAQPGSDRTVMWADGQRVGKSLVKADIQRIIDSLNKPSVHEPYYLTACLYDKAKAAGYPLDGVMRLAPNYAALPQRNYELLQEVADRERYNMMRPRPTTAAKSRAALHPLVARLIDNLNKEN